MSSPHKDSRALVAANVERMIAYVPGKPVKELERELGVKNAAKLASNENPYGPSPAVIEAVKQAAQSLHRYPDAGTFELRRALSVEHDVPMDQLVIGNGSNELIDLLCRTFATAEEHMVFGKPSFVCYWLGANAAGVPFTEVPLKEDLFWDVDAMLAAVTPKTKLLFLANPNNPTGTHLAGDEVRRLATRLPAHVILVLDEAYFEFADADDFESGLAMRQLRDRLVVLRTFSKAYGLAALRVGYAIGPANVIDYLNRMRAPFNVNALAQAAAIAALRDKPHMTQYVTKNKEERTRIRARLAEMGLTVAPSQTNFLLVKFDGLGKDLYDRLLRQGLIARVMPPPLQHWLRITLGTPSENDRMISALGTL